MLVALSVKQLTLTAFSLFFVYALAKGKSPGTSDNSWELKSVANPNEMFYLYNFDSILALLATFWTLLSLQAEQMDRVWGSDEMTPQCIAHLHLGIG